VVWWDPHILALGAESTFGLRRDDLIVKDGDMFAVEEKLAAYEGWREERQDTVKRGARKSLNVDTVTSWARTAQRDLEVARLADAVDEAPPSIEMIAISDADRRPYGPRFGTLVHSLLATIPLDASASAVWRIAETHARMLEATSDEMESAVEIAGRVLQQPLIIRAGAALARNRCHREMPVTWRAPDGTLVEGTIDLVFEDDEGVTVLDFKTDREVATDLERYRRQVTIYCRALASLRGRPARGVLMRV
jgi:ATP-dependent exoDNAse (exonuclease V) beta subunit